MTRILDSTFVLSSWPQSWEAAFALSLQDYSLLNLVPVDEKLETPLECYIRCMKFYLAGDSRNLEIQLSAIETRKVLHHFQDWQWVKRILTLRSKVRNRSVTDGDIRIFKEWLHKQEDLLVILFAESLFVIGQACDVVKSFREAAAFFAQSADLFQRTNVSSKMCRAKLNALSSQSCADPMMSLSSEYLALAYLSEKFNEGSTAGVCFMNVAREYQRNKIFDIALEYSEKANNCLKAEFGNLHSLLCLAGHVDILIDQQKIKEAKSQLNRLRIFPFVEIQEAVKVLDLRLNKDRNPAVNEKNCLPTWKERFEDLNLKSEDLQKTPLEKKLLELLNSGAKDKFELIEQLYGQESSFLVCENRLKNLLNRVRNRYPGKLKFNSGKYAFSSQSSRERLSS